MPSADFHVRRPNRALALHWQLPRGEWKPKEDALLATMPDHVLAELLDRHRDTVRKRRLKLGVSSFRKHGPFTPSREWTPADDALLGTMTDPEVAAHLGCTWRMVYNRRVKLGVSAHGRGE